jgi:hypothetical protein
MRRYSAGGAVVIAGDPATRSLLASLVSDRGCAVETGETAADLRRRIEGSSTDIVFLDLDLRDSDIFAMLDVLASRSFSGATQLIDGGCADTVQRAIRAGGRRGLRMREPLHRPLRADAIGRALREEGLQSTGDLRGRTELGLFHRPWACVSSPTGLIDLAIRSPNAGAEPPAALEQLLWWTALRDRYRTPLLDLPAPATICIVAQPVDVRETARVLAAAKPHPSHPAPTIVLREDDLFADLPAMRALLHDVRMRGASIRLTGCGTRFFAIAGHDPLPVEQAVLAPSLPVESRFMPRLIDLAHRAGTLLLVDDVASGRGASQSLVGLDFWRSAAQPWQMIEPELPSSLLPLARRRKVDTWRPVALADALSIRRDRHVAYDFTVWPRL